MLHDRNPHTDSTSSSAAVPRFKRIPMSKNNVSFGSHVGTASILLVFVVLALVSFAALSLISSNADYQLTRRISSRTKAYYQACDTASARLKLLENELKTFYSESRDEADYLNRIAQASVKTEFAFPIQDTQYLIVNVSPTYPTDSEPSLYRLTEYYVFNNTAELTYDESLNILKFND